MPAHFTPGQHVVMNANGVARGAVVTDEPHADSLPTGASFVPCRFDDDGTTANVDSRVLTLVEPSPYSIDTSCTAYALANDAGVACPDGLASPGAVFLEHVRDALAERIAHDAEEVARDPQDVAHEIADGAVPIYTADVWATFSDLAAWQVDTDDYVTAEDDMTRRASIALYVVAERLASTLLDQWAAETEEAAA